jgi:hypothetical protein
MHSKIPLIILLCVVVVSVACLVFLAREGFFCNTCKNKDEDVMYVKNGDQEVVMIGQNQKILGTM